MNISLAFRPTAFSEPAIEQRYGAGRLPPLNRSRRCNLCRKANADRRREYEYRVHPEVRRYQDRPKGQAKPL